MQLDHRFSVPAPLDVVWEALLDPERVAPCMPGASLSKVEGSEFAGSVKVKLGPVSLLYKGSGEFVETDEQARRVVIKASGKDSRGNGTAAATVTVTLSGNGDSTDGAVSTDLNITGRPAQFGRGMITEVGGKILDQFASCLSDKLGQQAAQSEPGAADAGSTAPLTAVPSDVPHAPVTPEREPEPLDLMQYAGGSMVKRLAPVAAAVAVLIAIATIISRRRSAS